MFAHALTKLWADEAGSVIAAEYLMLGTVVGLGGVAGLAGVRDAMTAEMGEYGNAVREVRQAYSVSAQGGENATAGGSAVVDRFGAADRRRSQPEPQAVTFAAP